MGSILSVGWREKEYIGNVAGKEWEIEFRCMSDRPLLWMGIVVSWHTVVF